MKIINISYKNNIIITFIIKFIVLLIIFLKIDIKKRNNINSYFVILI